MKTNTLFDLTVKFEHKVDLTVKFEHKVDLTVKFEHKVDLTVKFEHKFNMFLFKKTFVFKQRQLPKDDSVSVFRR